MTCRRLSATSYKIFPKFMSSSKPRRSVCIAFLLLLYLDFSLTQFQNFPLERIAASMEAPVVIKAFTIERRVGTTNTGEAPFAQPIPPQGTTVHARNRTNHPIRDRFVSEEEVDFLYDDAPNSSSSVMRNNGSTEASDGGVLLDLPPPRAAVRQVFHNGESNDDQQQQSQQPPPQVDRLTNSDEDSSRSFRGGGSTATSSTGSSRNTARGVRNSKRKPAEIYTPATTPSSTPPSSYASSFSSFEPTTTRSSSAISSSNSLSSSLDASPNPVVFSVMSGENKNSTDLDRPKLIQVPTPIHPPPLPAIMAMNTMTELDLKTDHQLQKTMQRTTMKMRDYGSEPITTTALPTGVPPIVFPEQPPNRLPFGPLIPVGPVLPLGTLNGGPLVPPHTHRATTTTPIPSTTTMLLPRSGTPAPATAGGLRSAETYEQVGCGWDLLSQSCKDVFTLGWCQHCTDFGNVFLRDCRCTAVSALYTNAAAFWATAAANAMANGAAVPIGGNLNPQQGGVPTFPAQVAAAPVLPLATLARVQQQREQQEQQRPRQYASGTVYIPRQGTALQLPTPPYSTASSSSAVGFMAAPSQQQQQQYVVESSPEPAAAVVYSLARTGGGQSPAAAAYEQVYSAADSGIKIRLSPTKYAKSRQRQQMTDQQQQIGAAAPSWPMMTPFKRHKH